MTNLSPKLWKNPVSSILLEDAKKNFFDCILSLLTRNINSQWIGNLKVKHEKKIDWFSTENWPKVSFIQGSWVNKLITEISWLYFLIFNLVNSFLKVCVRIKNLVTKNFGKNKLHVIFIIQLIFIYFKIIYLMKILQ